VKIKLGTVRRLGLRRPLRPWLIVSTGDAYDWTCGLCGTAGSTDARAAAEQELYDHAMAEWTRSRRENR
jgi:hypothetical protein